MLFESFVLPVLCEVFQESFLKFKAPEFFLGNQRASGIPLGVLSVFENVIREFCSPSSL